MCTKLVFDKVQAPGSGPCFKPGTGCWSGYSIASSTCIIVELSSSSQVTDSTCTGVLSLRLCARSALRALPPLLPLPQPVLLELSDELLH
jgi:hypothetical protein